MAAEANGQEKKTPVWKMSVPAARNEWVSCCVWENQAGNGENQFTVYAVQLEVRYKVGEEWRSGHSLRGSHIPLACWLLGKAYDHIQGLRAQVPF